MWVGAISILVTLDKLLPLSDFLLLSENVTNNITYLKGFSEGEIKDI